MNALSESDAAGIEKIGDQIEKLGWRQGSLLNLKENNSANIKAGLYVVISQDCDLIHPLFAGEPYVEILLLTPIEKINGTYGHGRNPRQMHLTLNDSNKQPHYYECLIVSRKFIDRKILTHLEPDRRYLTPDGTLESLITWVIKRYKRDAFPDKFNKSYDKDKLGKVLKKQIEGIWRICIKLNTYVEVNDEEMYKVELVMLVESVCPIPEREYRSFKNILEKIVDVLEKQGKIKVSTYDVKSLEDITVAEFFSLKELDFDYLSSRDLQE